MPEEREPDIDRVREAMRDHDERVEEDVPGEPDEGDEPDEAEHED